MAPIREYNCWGEREFETMNDIEVLRKYILVCEGSRTEVSYFKALIDCRERLGLHPLVDLRLWEKTGEDEGISNPQALLNFAKSEKENNRLLFDPKYDRMVIVFDLDIYSRVGEDRKGAEDREAEYDALRKRADADDILAVTNPSFELFLLLHSEGAYDRLVRPHEMEILENRKRGSQRYIQRLFTDVYGMNPKTNQRIGTLAKEVDLAIREEGFLNRDLDKALTELTSNIGSVIDEIRNYTPPV